MIQNQAVAPVSVGQLLSSDLRIPPYQRPYSWRIDTAMRLYDDLADAQRDAAVDGAPYVLGAVILHHHDGALDVVDGQQRLLTLRMLSSMLLEGSALTLDPSLDSAVGRVWRALQRRVGDLGVEERSALGDFILHRCEVVQVVTDDADEAFRVFDSQNYRGKALAPHDLLKAYHLREMSEETDAMKRAVVDAWESAADDDLDRLFSLYLYRIVKWSRGERAGVFTAQDIDTFKGLNARQAVSPSARYHLAAQAAIPMMKTWSCPMSGEVQRDFGRARFQLDAPVTAGRAFFEMTTFMLEELKDVRAEAYDKTWERFSSSDPETLREQPGRSRYRKVSELYVAALLYFTNRFGALDEEARRALFVWAYSPRVRLQRVQHASIDKHASGEDRAGLFSWIRRAQNRSEALRHTAVDLAAQAGHELELVEILKEAGSA